MGPTLVAFRASIMTGQFTARHGITSWIGDPAGAAWRRNNRHDSHLPADYVRGLPIGGAGTLAAALQAGGYVTGYFGKWHLGETEVTEHGELRVRLADETCLGLRHAQWLTCLRS
eukprot:SAG22_NODE_254_length_13588_cov_10.695678_10_plen_115_part_00